MNQTRAQRAFSPLPNNRYPTKEEILAVNIRFSQEELTLVKEWKKHNFSNGQWKRFSPLEKLHALELLAAGLNKINNGGDLSFTKSDTTAYYDGDTNSINIPPAKPSIISTLHELGHHLYGASEIAACRFSVSLFKQCFPQSYEKLQWKAHTLTQ